MMQKNNTYEHGFTLIELSIALVIIGLILGTVIYSSVATIGSTKVAKTISIVTDLSNALSQFKSKYKDLPGDIKIDATNPEILGLPASCLSSGANKGDGNGVIAGTYDGSGVLTGGESICVPADLFSAGMIRVDETDVNVVSKSSSHASGVANFNDTSHRNVINVIELANLPCDVVKELDSKIDNGDIASGNALAAASGSTAISSCTDGEIIPFYVIAL
jgi:prepilin-type N-terminal cleavage/methylation domain-containing protein